MKRWQWPPLMTALVLATFAIYGSLAVLDWPGVPSPCLTAVSCWCEPVAGGWARQPWNTWSNVPAVVAALLVAGVRTGGQREHWFRAAFSYALLAAGAGALFFHGSLTRWSQLADRTSILMTWGAVLSTSAVRMGFLRLAQLPFAVIGTSLAAVLYIPVLGLDINIGGLSCLVAFLGLEVAIRRRSGTPADSRGLRIALGAFGVAMVAWVLSRPGSVACGWPVPTHAVWHVAVAVALVALSAHATQRA